MPHARDCPRCGHRLPPRGPAVTVDVIVQNARGEVVLIERRHPPHGWALPGGFVDRGERVEVAARREVREETHLDVNPLHLVGVYSDPARDPRGHTVTIVFSTRCDDEPRADDDAVSVGVFPIDALPAEMAFDHREIITDFVSRGADA